MKSTLLVLFIVAATSLLSQKVLAQGEQKAIIFTGVVVAGKNTERLPGAYIFIPRAGRGTLTNNVGYFSIPVFPGDSIVYSYVGYRTQYHVIPRDYNAPTYSAIIQMQESVTMLAEVRVYPYATEEEFKKAFLALKLPDQVDRDALARSTDIDYINRLAAQMPNNAQTNYRYTMDQQLFGRESAANKGFATTFPFLNPFAWGRFIKSVQDGDLKQKDFRKELNQTPRESMSRQDFIKK
ncbi:carboxypeptidase-like regulatory domain-containing protein [Persicitalea sp.]|uniref:carboxypeptidase-like regulatory domain-containing protein n=1 Tax=Persicitalea sp. TaxID=3100273 RepID=UPI003594170F